MAESSQCDTVWSCRSRRERHIHREPQDVEGVQETKVRTTKEYTGS